MSLVAIQKALITDDLEAAVKGMLTLAAELKNDKLYSEVIHQSGRYHSNEKGKLQGTTSPEQYERSRNQLRYALQELIKRFPGYSIEVNIQAQQEAQRETVPAPSKTGAGGRKDEDSIKILMLTSNPTRTAELKLNDEYALISRNRDAAPNPSRFQIVSHQAVTLPEFTRFLFAERPVIVHFSGHGEQDSQEVRDFIRRGQQLESLSDLKKDNTGIILTDLNKKDPFFVGTSVIRQIFSTMVEKRQVPIQAVIFNSCYSEAQAQAIADLVPHVIGTSWSVGDQAAIAFANGFYSFFTQTEDYEAAWDDGVIQAMAYGEPKEKFIYFKHGQRV